MRQGDGDVREALRQIVGCLELVRGVLEGEQEADGDRFIFLALHRLDERIQILARQRLHHRTVGGDALACGMSVFERRKRLRLVPADGEDLAAIIALDGVDVAEIAGGQQCDLGAAPGQERIQPDGRAMDEEVDPGIRLDRRLDAFQNRESRILGR